MMEEGMGLVAKDAICDQIGLLPLLAKRMRFVAFAPAA